MVAVNANDVDLAEVLGTRETPALEFKSTAKRQGCHRQCRLRYGQ